MLYAGKWGIEEHQNVLEARTAVQVLRRMSRDEKAWGKRVLIVSDSLVTIGCVSKGRSSSRPLLKVARMAGVIQLVCKVRPYFRWVASETNLADGPSRGEGVGVAEETAKKAKALKQKVMPMALRRTFQAERRRCRGRCASWWS